MSALRYLFKPVQVPVLRPLLDLPGVLTVCTYTDGTGLDDPPGLDRCHARVCMYTRTYATPILTECRGGFPRCVHVPSDVFVSRQSSGS